MLKKQSKAKHNLISLIATVKIKLYTALKKIKVDVALSKLLHFKEKVSTVSGEKTEIDIDSNGVVKNKEKSVLTKKAQITTGAVVGGIVLLVLIINLSGGIRISNDKIKKHAMSDKNLIAIEFDAAFLTFKPFPVISLKNVRMKFMSYSIQSREVTIKKSAFSLFSMKHSSLKSVTIKNGLIQVQKLAEGISSAQYIDNLIFSTSLLSQNHNYKIHMIGVDCIVNNRGSKSLFSINNMIYKNTNRRYIIGGTVTYLNDVHSVHFMIDKKLDLLHSIRSISIETSSDVFSTTLHVVSAGDSGVLESREVDLKMVVNKPLIFIKNVLGNNIPLFSSFSDGVFNPINLNLSYLEDVKNKSIRMKQGSVSGKNIVGSIDAKLKNGVIDWFIGLSKLELYNMPDLSNTTNKVQPVGVKKPKLDKNRYEFMQTVRFSDFFSKRDFFLEVKAPQFRFNADTFAMNFELEKVDNRVNINSASLSNKSLVDIKGSGFIEDVDTFGVKYFLNLDLEGKDLGYLRNFFSSFGIEKLVRDVSFDTSYKMSTDLVLSNNFIVAENIDIDMSGVGITGRFQKSFDRKYNSDDLLELSLNGVNLDNVTFDFSKLKQSSRVGLYMIPLNNIENTQILNVKCVQCTLKENPLDVDFSFEVGNKKLSINRLKVKTPEREISGNFNLDFRNSKPFVTSFWNLKGNFEEVSLKSLVNTVSKKFAFQDFDGFYGEIGVSIEDIVGKYVITKGKQSIRGTIKNGNLQIPKFTFTTLDKKDSEKSSEYTVFGSGGLSGQGSLFLNYEIKNPNATQILSFFTGREGISAKSGAIKGTLTTKGSSIRSLLYNLSGDGKFVFNGFNIQTMSLEKVSSRLRSRKKITLNKPRINNLFYSPVAKSYFDTIKGDFIFNLGTIILTDTLMTSKFTNIKLNTKYNLMDYTFTSTGRGVTSALDLKTRMTSMIPLYFSFGVAGNIDSKPKFAYNLSQIYSYTEARKMFNS